MTPADLIDLGMAAVEVAAARPDGTCSCRLGIECPSPGKHPIGRGWLASAISRRERGYRRLPVFVVAAPNTSYGLVPMPGSGIIVIDRDDPSVLLPMPPTFEVHRGSAPAGKGHYYGRLDAVVDEADVPRSFAGGEVRVAGSGHVVGPGCRHASGDLYAGSGEDVATFDSAVIDALRAAPPVRKREVGGRVEAVVGSRHEFLVGQARKMAGWGYGADRIEDELRALNDTVCMPPLSERDAEFGRMASWAAANVRPDAPARITWRRR